MRIPFTAFAFQVLRMALWWALAACVLPAVAQQPLDPVFQAQPEGVRITRMSALADPAAGAEPTPPSDALKWQPLDLPDRWSHTHPGFGGSVWYRARIDFAQAPAAPWALYLPRVLMNAELWVNGVLMGRAGRMAEPITRNWNTPLLFSTPHTAWRSGANTVHLRVVAYPDDAGGLAPPMLGRTDVMTVLHSRQGFWQNDLVYAANIAVIAMGLFVLAVWLRKRERADYGYFGAGALLWGLSNFNMTVRDVPLSYFHWELLVFVSIVWALLSLCLFGLRFGGAPRPWLERGFLAYGLACAVVLWASGATGAVRMGAWWLLPVLLLGGWSMWQIVGFVRRVRLVDYSFFAVVVIGTLSLGAHDWLLQMGWLRFDTAHALPFAAPLLLAALGWLIAGDYARTQQDLALLNRDLAGRVLQKEAELRGSFARVADLERAQAVAAERSRILRDMHDGVGTHLTSAIRQLQSGLAAPGAVEQTLRDSLDQLKLSIDAMTLREGDVGGLLGSLRFRLAPRLQAAGLRLSWHVDALPHWPGGHGEALRHLQYIVFEAFSNVLQHAQATELTLRATTQGSEIEVCIEDNGRGCDGHVPGNGLRSLQTRAVAMDAQLQLQNRPEGGCRVVLRLPLAPIRASRPPLR